MVHVELTRFDAGGGDERAGGMAGRIKHRATKVAQPQDVPGRREGEVGGLPPCHLFGEVLQEQAGRATVRLR